jgi:hypothetical protein
MVSPLKSQLDFYNNVVKLARAGMNFKFEEKNCREQINCPQL